MRFLHFYLIAYFVLIAGALLTLWRGGVLGRISPLALFFVAAVAILLGVLVAITSVRPSATD